MDEDFIIEDPIDDTSDDDVEEDSDFEDDYDEDDNVPDNPEKEIIGEYLLYLRSSTRATNEDVTNILRKMEVVVKWYLSRHLNNIRNILGETHNINLNEYIDIDEIINNIDCSQGLNSIHNQNKYFEEKFKVVLPDRIRLGEKFVPYGSSSIYGNQPLKIKKDEFIHVPISKVLTAWLGNGSFGNILFNPRRNENQAIETYMDGSYFQNHSYKLQKPNCKFIKLYFDEVDMCDAVGSKSSSTNKLGMFYWMDDDISSENKSQLKFINLAGVVSNPHINVYGMNAILQHIINDLKQIQNGIRLSNGDVIYGTLSVLIGDNLGVHQCCGFRESFSALHPCRICKANMTQIKTMCSEDATILRTAEEHERRVQEIEAAVGEQQKAALRTLYGINRRSVLNEIENFDVTQSTPPDLTHDDLLGICIITTRLFLKEVCCTLELITLHDLNQRIANYDYGYTEKSAKPSPITETQLLDASKGFKQTASQMLQLVTMLPLIVSDRVVQGWSPLENYLKMLEIILISHADKIPISILGYLESCISEYLETFQTCYNRDLIPKQHFLVHRIRAILKFGPLQNYSTMRAEAKHQYFKRIAQCMRTYKNLPLTLANKHQLNQAYVMNGILDRDLSVGPTKWVSILALPFSAMFPDVRRLQIANWVKINGIKYVSTKCFLAVRYSDQNIPEFAALHAIIWRNNSALFVCRTVTTMEHNVNLMAYEIRINEDYICLSINDLLTVDVFHAHRWNNSQYIILKKALGNLH
ncbi:uncharacterized protein LOC122504689 [Leptopilina heterotoma]|uniref:uncharacterized protein LOC122503235 n=1 Tax=Leptopilina heterotoma TaxID=63436 RepID=UPI001CA9320A|nr:uncharacterized protein LOC122503235 [Leptopilina heterotoma]XP_043471834.1 uncharacterized protein LOC122504689 [Leptopilina heterotoma]